MNLNDLIPIATAIIGALGGYLTTKSTNRSNRDNQLWAELREELTYHRDKVDELTQKVELLHETNLKQQVLIQNLEDKIDDLTKVNGKLETENRQLNVKVDELMDKLNSFNEKE